jgi:hypothetical protein
MLSFIKKLLTDTVEVAEYNPGLSLRVSGIPFDRLTGWLAELPEVTFTRKKIWLSDHEADFTLRGQAFLLETDTWDGAFWISPRDGARPEELRELREQIERRLEAAGIAFVRKPV